MEKKKINARVFALIFLFCCLLIPFLNLGASFASADSKVYSNVLEDLQKDENFNIEDYPVIEKNYSLQLIQIAESEDQELFVYVYQPSGQSQDLRATTIRFSTAINENFSPKDYNLTFLNSNETLYKYKVEDFKVKEDALRYYQIIAIHRVWNENFDEPLNVGGIIDEVVFEVAQLWTASTVNGEVSFNCTISQVVNITGKYAGLLRYSNGVAFNDTWTDAHFVAFSTDYQIDNLLNAKVGFVETRYKYVQSSLTKPGHTIILNGPEEKEVEINCDELGEMVPNYEWFPNKHTWKRIQTVEEFKEKENLTYIAEKELEGMEYVLRFTETLREGSYNGEEKDIMAIYSTISKITILRLKFQTDGEVFNLGVVDNKQTGDGIPDNEYVGLKWWQILLMILGFIFGVLALFFIVPILKFVGFVLKIIFYVIWYILKGIWWVITLPLEIFKR